MSGCGACAADGWTALMYASVEGHAVLISGLLKAGANKELKNKDGMTAWAR